MIPLAMIVVDELRDGMPEVPLTDGNDPIETFFLDRPYESLGVGVRVGRALWDQHHVDARVPEPTPDIRAPFPIPIAGRGFRFGSQRHRASWPASTLPGQAQKGKPKGGAQSIRRFVAQRDR